MMRKKRRASVDKGEGEAVTTSKYRGYINITAVNDNVCLWTFPKTLPTEASTHPEPDPTVTNPHIHAQNGIMWQGHCMFLMLTNVV